MSQVLFGPRLGREGQLRVGCSAMIFDNAREKVLPWRRINLRFLNRKAREEREETRNSLRTSCSSR